MSDLIAYICHRACLRFGPPSDGLFNAAGFSVAWQEVTGLHLGLDGEAVRAMLHGRDDVEPMPGGAHFRLVRPAP